MTTAAMPKVGDLVAAKYMVEAVVGEGGMGTVYAATHKLTGKRVALKWMLPELAREDGAVQRFMREAQAAGRIDHPNVVDIYDVGEHEGSLFLVMEYLHGEPLTAAIERRELGWQQVVQLIVPAMRGVAAAHRKGVIHRDLKPDNIFLCRDADGAYREPKVLDFGISKLSSADGQANMRLTKTGAVVGTPYYMSPEQVRGASDVDHRGDIYAFGVILYESLTGQVPFNADTYSALILEIATGTPRRPSTLDPELPPALEEVVLKAMARDPDRRYQTIEQLAQALEPFSGGVTLGPDRRDPTGRANLNVTATDTPFASEVPPITIPRTTNPLAIVLGTAGLVVLGGVAGYWFMHRGGPSEAEAAGEAGAGAPQVEPDEPAPTPVAAPPQEDDLPAPVLAASGKVDAGPAQEEAESEAAAEPADEAAPPRRARPERDRGRARPDTPRRTGRTGSIAVDEF